VIRADNLCKNFGDVIAVDGIGFDAPDGRVTGLLGPNGAGKTTTLRMIATLVEPSGGSASVDGFDVRDSAIEVRRRLGVLSDARGLYGRLTARENIRYYGELRGLAPEAIAAQVEKFARVLDLGALLDRRTEGFSQGERMKVAIARALVHDPQNILLDEPTNGLDVMTTRAMRELVRELRESGKCVVFSSHVMQEVTALCDEIVIVAHGRVAARGAPEAIREASGKATLEDAFVSLTGEGA
jgi:sodium transport system ATP-binding protein